MNRVAAWGARAVFGLGVSPCMPHMPTTSAPALTSPLLPRCRYCCRFDQIMAMTDVAKLKRLEAYME